MANPIEFGPLPPRFAELKKEIVASYPDFEARATKAWGEILADLDKVTRDIAAQGSAVSSIAVLVDDRIDRRRRTRSGACDAWLCG